MAVVDAPFEQALKDAKAGHKINRLGWSNPKMYVVIQRGYPDGIPINRNTAEATGIPEGTEQRFLPYLMQRTAEGDFVPWTPSQVDLLANDWVVV
jgi:hypothetical protein